MAEPPLASSACAPPAETLTRVIVPLATSTRKSEVPLWKKEVYVGGEEWIGRGSYASPRARG
jgi:hypothetical protein